MLFTIGKKPTKVSNAEPINQRFKNPAFHEGRLQAVEGYPS